MVKRLRPLRLVVALLAVTAMGALLPPTAATAQVSGQPITIAVIPDTQIYVQSDAGTEFFRDQFEWIVDEQAAQNIVFVTHEGDVAQDPSSPVEWDRIESVFALLDDAAMPYGIAPGNHDINPDGSAPEYDARFGVTRFAGLPWFGNNHQPEGNRSSYQQLAVEGHKLLFLHLRHLQPQYGDVPAVLDWAGQVLADHPDHLVFVTTHEFTSGDGSVLVPALADVVEDSCNVVAVFSGHRGGEAARGTLNDACGRTVHHMLTNYQFIANGGQGFLRMVAIDPLTLQADFTVYSPTLDEFRTGADEEFTVPLAPLVPVPGDVSCDRALNIFDAVMVAQFVASLRTISTGCPLVDPQTELNGAAADTTGDGIVNVLDAVVIAQCVADLSNQLCP